MKTDEQINSEMDACEQEIREVLKKFGMSLGMLYDEGVAITLVHQQKYPSGDYSFLERECF